MDYREHYSDILTAFESDDVHGRTASLLSASGRAFWTEITSDGWIPHELADSMAKLPYEQVRLFVLFLADSLRWTALNSLDDCPLCDCEFSSDHFFSCLSADFLSGREWTVFITLCRNGAWQDAIESFFAVMKRWATETQLLRPMVALNIMEFAPQPNPNPFRLNIF
jgi:hypothetical protein